jgi:hypothetical protein
MAPRPSPAPPRWCIPARRISSVWLTGSACGRILTPTLDQARRRKFRREFWWVWEADDEPQLRRWAASFCRRWQFGAPRMVEKFQAELPRVLPYLRWPPAWRHRLPTTNLAEGFFRHLRRYLGRFPGCVDPAHSEQVLGCFILACEQAHA